jgi:hypothetical protein
VLTKNAPESGTTRTKISPWFEPPEQALAEDVRGHLASIDSVNGLFVPGLSDGDAMAAIAEAIKPMPLNIMALPGLPPMDALQKHGVRRLSAGSAIAQAALGCTSRLAAGFLAGTIGEIRDCGVRHRE